MLHLWEARVPLTESLLKQFRKRIREVCVDPTAGITPGTATTAAAGTQDQHGPCRSAAPVDLGDSNSNKLESLIDDMRSLSYAQMARLVREPYTMPVSDKCNMSTLKDLKDLFVRQYNRFERISAAFNVFQGDYSSSIQFSYNDD